MGYSEFIKELLRPLYVYDLDIGAGASELEALGEALDAAEETASELCSEANPVTAGELGISMYEAILPFGSMYGEIESRRTAVMGLLRIDDGSFTVEDMNATLSGCGVTARITESDEPYTVKVSFPNMHSVPENFDGIKERIEKVLPCHLNVIYVFTYPTWAAIETVGTWAELERARMTWDDIEHYGQEN